MRKIMRVHEHSIAVMNPHSTGCLQMEVNTGYISDFPVIKTTNLSIVL
jgi:hypothetical protein